MTKRGSIVYYLTAWVWGCISLATLVWCVVPDRERLSWRMGQDSAVASFLVTCLSALLLGAPAALLFAWLLRRAVLWARWDGALRWVLAGSVLAPLVIAALGTASHYFFQIGADTYGILALTVTVLLAGPGGIYPPGILVAVPAGALTAYVLFLVHRAFDPRQCNAG